MGDAFAAEYVTSVTGVVVPDPRVRGGDDDSAMRLAVGLGVGLGAFALCVALTCHCRRRRRRRMQDGGGLELATVKGELGGDADLPDSPTGRPPRKRGLLRLFSSGGAGPPPPGSASSSAGRDSIAMLRKNHQTKTFTTNPLASPAAGT